MIKIKKFRVEEFRHYSDFRPEAFVLWGAPLTGQGDERTSGEDQVDDLNLPKEVGTAEAAQILGVTKDTVLKFRTAGLLKYRNAAPPGSSRPVYRFLLESVLELRTCYETEEPTAQLTREPHRRQEKGKRKYKYIDFD